MDNNQHWRGGSNRGRGRGRGRGGGNSNRNDGFGGQSNNNAYNNDYNNSAGANISITSRLGPTNNPINDRIVQPAQQQPQQYSNNNNYNNSNNYNDNQRGRGGRGRAFNNYRGGGNRGDSRQGNPQFSREFMDEDVNIDSVGEIIITVTGYPPQSEEKVLGFLTRKSKTPWEPLNIATEGTTMQITVANEQIADSLCHMNEWNFGNSTLKITKGGFIPSSGSNAFGGNRDNRGGGNFNNRNTRQGGGQQQGGRNKILCDFLLERWTEESGFLDMDEIPETSHNIGIVVSRLLDQAKLLFGDRLKTISFARNKLWSVAPLTKTAELFPNLSNLSVADNLITEFRSLDKLGQKFNALQELMLSGNPIQQNTDLQKYQFEVLKRFPTVQYLDQLPVQGTGPIGFTQQQAVAVPLPVPTRSNFFDHESSSHAAQDLLSKFFPLFDTNRAALVDLYDAQAVFSVVFADGTFQQQKVWGSSQVPPGQRMVLGNENIMKKFISLPPTMHDLSSANNFVTDAWQTTTTQQQVLLNLVVHGEFAEIPAGTPVSFDRTFIVAPATPGSRALAAGWSYVILNDSLVVRDFSGKPAQLVTA